MANNAGYYEIQVDDPVNPTARIECTLDACPGENCPCEESFTCTEFTSGTYCGKPAGMCGQVADIVATDDFFSDDGLSSDVLCDSMQGRGCDVTLGGVDNPAQVMCYTGVFTDAPQSGICLSICGMPQEDGTYEMYNCPEGMVCDTDIGFFYDVATDANGENVTCEITDAGADDTACAAYPGMKCEALTGGNFCARPYGSCNYPHSEEDAGMSEDSGVSTDASVETDAGMASDATVTDVEPGDVDPSDVDPSDTDPSDTDPSDTDPSDGNPSDG